MARILKSPQCHCVEVLPDGCAFRAHICFNELCEEKVFQTCIFCYFSMTKAFYHCKYSAVIVEKN